MKFSPTDTQALIALLGNLYGDIAELETRFNLRAGAGDMRVRIEYFHDAVRALTSGQQARLSVELLAYDLRALRYLTQHPLLPFREDNTSLSPKTGLIKTGPGLMPQQARPDRETKTRLSELYQQYSVIFAALFKITADNDVQDRAEELDDTVAQIHAQIIQLGNKPSAQARVNTLKAQIKAHDKSLKKLDDAHMDFATAQLAIFEDAKDMLKAMAGKGMNLVGKFVASTMAEAKQQQRGR